MINVALGRQGHAVNINYEADIDTVQQTVRAADTKGLRDLLTQLFNDYQAKNRTYWKQTAVALTILLVVPIALILKFDGWFAIRTWEYWSFHISTSIILPLSGLFLVKVKLTDPYYHWRHKHLSWVITVDNVTLERFTVPTGHVMHFGTGAPVPPSDDDVIETPPSP